ncbi:Transcriptional regulator, AraC family [Mucinivorans hirudinis]|uniref:Transcriptional regulator, AraC family n=1 Tax=Mucinivorans hirudinis TaxID=1433126 RepID=A0A060RBC3_9BACT|nr:Transcriptional regulator, AraC family [Mucinivorans hirudinis]
MNVLEGFKGQQILVLPRFVVDEFAKDTFASNLHLTDIGFFPNAENHYCNRENGCNQYILIFCRGGKGWYEIEGERYDVSADEFFVLPPNVAHSYGANKFNHWSIYWVHFQGSFARDFAKDYLRPTKIYPYFNNTVVNVIGTFEQIFLTLRQGYSMDNMRFALSSLYYFLGSLSYMSTSREIPLESDAEIDLSQNAILYMKSNIDKKIEIKELAGKLGVTPAQLSQKFKDKTGYAVLSYFNHLKIQHACTLLDNTSMNIMQISAMLGIEDSLYFSRLFTQIMGICPRDYRKMTKG